MIDLAENLKPLFRTDDIIGRIGGDEFFVFLKRCDSEKLIKSKAADICNAFKNTYTVDGICVSVTASIGIASFPKNGTDFNTLYKNADTALYITKEHGKNNFTMHDGVSTANYQSTRTKIDS
ncbi:putative signaling protein [bioreactor metagenome]|uniref:Putative signaling protein n=1 Tax=bioreactor metagenome TaxID=1076179 RepID=A0A645DWZ9_9ZZZZ